MSVNGFALAASIALLTVPLQNAPAQIDHSHREESGAPTNIGRVAFPTSCSAKAQVDLEKGVALLHSFWYEEATKEFDAASAADPSCAMAHWGHAMSLFHQLWENPDTAARREALAALNSARKSGSATPRERAYIDALAQYYEVKPKAPADTATPDERLHAYRDAMRDVTRKFPADDEAKVFYGLAIIAAGPYGDTTFTEQKRADSVLLPLVAKYPTHPGLFHYIIHANDEPQLAPLALDAARRYAQLAPAIPHAQHMPSHIFIRLGLWDEVIASNELATGSGTAYARKEKMDGEWPHNVNTMDFLQNAYLQEGLDRDAQRITDRVVSIEKLFGPVPDNAYIRYFKAFFHARQLLEQGRWREAAAFRVTVQPDTAVWSNVVLAFTNGLGAARSGDPKTAAVAVTRLDSLRGAFLTQKDTAAARITANMQTSVSAWLQLALGNRDEAEGHRLKTFANTAIRVGVFMCVTDTWIRKSIGKRSIRPGTSTPSAGSRLRRGNLSTS